jgi:HSP20 family molecular chaperone IbpA
MKNTKDKKSLGLKSIIVEQENLKKKNVDVSSVAVHVFEPAMNVYETDQSYIFILEMVGMDENKVDISREGNLIRVETRASVFDIPVNAKVQQHEFGSVKFERRFKLPSDADWNRREVAFRNGILYLTVYKTSAWMLN